MNNTFDSTRRCFSLFESRENLISILDAATNKLQIPATIIGAAALPHYNYSRATEDIDLITTVDDAYKLGDYLEKTGDFEFIGHSKFKHIKSGMDVNFCPTGVMAGRQEFPNPESNDPGLTYASLPLLLQLKIQANRIRDRADVVELIKRNEISMGYIKQNMLPRLSGLNKQLIIKLWQDAQSEIAESLDRANLM